MKWKQIDKRRRVVESHPILRMNIYKCRTLGGQSYKLWFAGRKVPIEGHGFRTLRKAQIYVCALCQEAGPQLTKMGDGLILTESK